MQALLQQMQSDNARLTKILSSTEEYREFSAYSDDSGGLTYVPPPAAGSLPTPPLRDGALSGSEGMTALFPARERPVKGTANEVDYWVPSDAYALANEFRREHVRWLPPPSTRPVPRPVPSPATLPAT